MQRACSQGIGLVGVDDLNPYNAKHEDVPKVHMYANRVCVEVHRVV